MFSATRPKSWLVLAGLTIVAGFFRLYRLHTLPLGLFQDEAMNGNDAIIALRTGRFHIFYPANNGREGLFINLQAVSLAIFGATPWALRVVSAMTGVLTVIGLYVLIRDLYDERHAIIAGVFQAIFVWPVVTSRLGLRAQMAAMMLVWALWATHRAFRSEQKWWAMLAAVLTGFGLYTYTAFRAAPAIIAVMAIMLYKPNSKKSAAILTIVFIAIAAPLMLYFAQHPEMFSEHAAHVSVFHQKSGPVLGIGYNAAKEIESFFWQGDVVRRHNAGSAPFVSWFAQPFFLIGLWLILRSIAMPDRRSIVILAWIVIGSVPDLLAESIAQPHGLRLILIQPVLPLIAAMGFVFVYDWLAARYSSRFVMIAVVAILLATMMYNYNAIFRRWASDPKMHHDFNYPQYELARMLDTTTSAKRRVVVAPVFGDRPHGIPVLAQSVAFLTHTVTADSQNVKNIHYAFEGEVTPSDSVELYPLPW